MLPGLLAALADSRPPSAPPLRVTLLITEDDRPAIGDALADFVAANGSDSLQLLVPQSRPLSLSEQRELPRLIPADTDVLWIPHLNIPVRFRGRGTDGTPQTRLVVTLHDLEMRYLSGGGWRKLAVYVYARLIFPVIRRRARALLCDSAFTHSEWLRFYGPARPAQILTTIPLGVEPAFFHAQRGAADHLTPRPYLLYVGNVKPHKNLRRLIEAFLLVQDQLGDLDLVLAGKLDGLRSADREIPALVERGGERIRLTGRVSQAELEALYAGAELFVFPSLYEGFGLPPLEAMAAGTPVAAANIPVVREACQSAAEYFDPRNPADMGRALIAVATNPERARELRAAGQVRAAEMNWQRCVDQTAATFQTVLGW